jgi:hypothetical protein
MGTSIFRRGDCMLTAKQEKRIIYLAYFCRYGYIAFMLLLLFGLRLSNFKEYTNFLLYWMAIFYGMYLLIGLRFRFKHLYCAMQDSYHQKMTPRSSCAFTDTMVRDILILGFGFILGGTVAIVVTTLYT